MATVFCVGDGGTRGYWGCDQQGAQGPCYRVAFGATQDDAAAEKFQGRTGNPL